jgi:ATP-dependent DNA helicase RecQ
MYRGGMTIADIASERGVTATTVENHLIRYIPTGEVMLSDFVLDDRIAPIRAAILQCSDSEALSPIKQLLGEAVTYTEIRAVMAAMVRQT